MRFSADRHRQRQVDSSSLASLRYPAFEFRDRARRFQLVVRWTFLLGMSWSAAVAFSLNVTNGISVTVMAMGFALMVGAFVALPALIFTIPLLVGTNLHRASAIVFPACILCGLASPFIAIEIVHLISIKVFLGSLCFCAKSKWVSNVSEDAPGAASSTPETADPRFFGECSRDGQ